MAGTSRCLGWLLVGALVGCGEPPQDEAVGSYTIDHDAFVDEAISAMKDAGLLEAGTEMLARGQLRQVRMDLDIENDRTFECRMEALGQNNTYTGNWTQVGSHFRLEQTHENGNQSLDVMTGTYRNGVLRLLHNEPGIEMPYVLRKRTRAASPN